MKYAGIGSRATPMEILKVIRELAARLDSLGYTVSTGGALGADKAFIDGSTSTELWLPFDGYNDYKSDLPKPTEIEEKFASMYHPKWSACGRVARLMHARNCNIVLGDVNNPSPVDFVVCWTPHGVPSGGTAQAISIAIDYDIPIFNLGSRRGYQRVINDLFEFLETL